MASHHRHQSSLEEVIDFDAASPLTEDQRRTARARFLNIVTHFEAANTANDDSTYNRPALVRLTYEYARSTESQDNLLRAFFQSVALPIDGTQELHLEDDPDLEEQLRGALVGFADFLLDNFFLPCIENHVPIFHQMPETR